MLSAPLDSADFPGPGTAAPVVEPPSGTTDAPDARLRSARNSTDAHEALDPNCLDPNSEGLEPDLPWEGKNKGEKGESPSTIFNLWSEEATCYVCESSVKMCGATSSCSLCGLRAPRKLSVEESEARAEALLNSEQRIDRDELDDLLASSLCSWNPKTRRLDQSLRGTGTLGWTLGFYRYGPKVGITKETLKRPMLTQIVNRFMRQEGGQGSWASVRVTSGFASDVHRDNNEKGSLNLLVPVSRFRKGRLWVEGQPLKGEEPEIREVQGERVVGRLIGGDSEVSWFDASQRHSVERAEGTRRVLVGYTPKSLDTLSLDFQQRLCALGFPLPSPSGVGSTLNPQLSSLQAQCSISASDVDCEPEELCLWEGVVTDPELDQLQHEHCMLRRVLTEQQKHLHEEIGLAASEGWEHETSHLRDLHCWINDIEGCLLHHVTKRQLSDPHVTSDERCVLEARLRSLGFF